jgi:hypothetical protein
MGETLILVLVLAGVVAVGVALWRSGRTDGGAAGEAGTTAAIAGDVDGHHAAAGARHHDDAHGGDGDGDGGGDGGDGGS